MNSETSMYPELLANSEKLVSEHERIYFEKQEQNANLSPSNLINNTIIPDKIPEPSIQKLPDIIPPPVQSVQPVQVQQVQPQPQVQEISVQMQENELIRKKMRLLKELEKMASKGVKLRQSYNMESDIAAMEFEYNLHKDEGAKQNSVKLMGSALLIMVNVLQMANDQYNPFDFKLDGWQDCIVSDMDNYYDVFGEIYDKHYKVGSASPPEMRLLMLLISSIMALQMRKCMNNFMGAKQTEQPKVDPEEKFKNYVKKEQTKNNKIVEEQIEEMKCISKDKNEYEKITKNATLLKDKLAVSTDMNNDDDISVSSKSRSRVSVNPNINMILSDASLLRHDEISMGKSLSGKKRKK